MSELVFGTKSGAVKRTFMLDKELKELHTAWFPRIGVNGRMVFVGNEDSPTGRVEFDTHYKAAKFAKKFLEEKRGDSHD